MSKDLTLETLLAQARQRIFNGENIFRVIMWITHTAQGQGVAVQHDGAEMRRRLLRGAAEELGEAPNAPSQMGECDDGGGADADADTDHEGVSDSGASGIASMTSDSHQPPTRLIFTALRKPGGAHAPQSRLAAECNGVVVDTVSFRPVAAPPGVLSRSFDEAKVDVALATSRAEVYWVIDGTVLTLYYSHAHKEWCLSSTHGIDVSFLVWRGELTFAEIVYDLMTRLAPDFARAAELELIGGREPRLNFGRLSTDYCYTLVVRHPALQPTQGDPARLVQIHSSWVGAGPEDAAGLPDSPCVLPGGVLRFVEQQRPLELGGPVTCGGLRSAGARALQEIVDRAAGADAPLALEDPSALEALKPAGEQYCYGFIVAMRGLSDAGKRGGSRVIIDSPLLAFLRERLYNPPLRNDRRDITAAERGLYSYILAYLEEKLEDAPGRGSGAAGGTSEPPLRSFDLLGICCPQFAKLREEIVETTEKLCKQLLLRLRSAEMDVSYATVPYATTDPFSDVLGVLATTFRQQYPSASMFHTIKPGRHEIGVHPEKLVQRVVYDRNNALLYVRLLHKLGHSMP